MPLPLFLWWKLQENCVKIKNTLSNIKREVSSVTNEIDIDDISDQKNIKKDNKNKDE